MPSRAPRGVEYPEIDIREVWREVLAEWVAAGSIPPLADAFDFEQMAVAYEVRANPVWPMPGLEPCLAEIRRRNLLMGIVSNAQFFTPMLFPALLESSLESLGFDPQIQYYSYRHGEAKPGEGLYRRAAESLASRSITADEVVYVGNDLLNDMTPAAGVGFRTALFAGDARSYRPREGDRRVAGIEPDLVLTELTQLAECLVA